MSEYSELSHKHLANQPGTAVNQNYPVYEQHHMQHPQSPAAWKSSPMLVPQPAPRMSVSNLLSGSFRSRAAPAAPTQTLSPPSPPAQIPPAPALRRLPSFADILARTNLLHLMGRSSEPTEAPAPAIEAPMEVQTEQMYQAPPPMDNFRPFVPPQVDTNVSMDMTPTVGEDVGAASPVSQSSETNKRRERWTEDEHARFMEGLNRYGRKWKKIQTFVKTKTAVQVRTHAYGYFAKLLRNMPEDDAIWELAEEMSSLPGAVLKGPGNGKRRNEPKTDEAGMEVLRRFVFSKKKTDDKKQLPAPGAVDEDRENVEMAESTPSNANSTAPTGSWSSTQQWKADDSDALLEIKRQRLN
ncbi:hypothetical protein BBO99_00009430 [Phytophthora kernoviae]|uniref:Uncharacterized protein n=2 Tax=Phytophthora kernoviae TaxID=325452 RepID=A0A3R7GT43_9STRA|nr:hypothetical protein G195_011086 [Phytophthora kernoviae 00238/432]KAG2507298.1 hypothetical protein JM18_009312 [Phytophthora kernoviae]RLN37800.1 hypothetical protein BBI17_006709 [Phytophthora kernoviae]RLN73442.1 hypothetical protein BBO99_00009430 [Phytophthora kernoviae]